MPREDELLIPPGICLVVRDICDLGHGLKMVQCEEDANAPALLPGWARAPPATTTTATGTKAYTVRRSEQHTWLGAATVVIVAAAAASAVDVTAAAPAAAAVVVGLLLKLARWLPGPPLPASAVDDDETFAVDGIVAVAAV